MKIILVLFLFYIGIYTSSSQVLDSLKTERQSFIIDSNLSYEFSKPKILDMFKYIPKDLVGLGKYIINKKNITPLMLATSSTIAIMPFDETLTKGASNLGNHLNLDNEGTYLRIKGVRMLPSNLPAAVYFIGNGGTTLLLSGGFFIVGKLKNDYRMQTTSSELIEVIFSTGLVSQTFKRITGRQSPTSGKTAKNSSFQWTPFPSFKAYQSHTPEYDAMPSGHLMTYMASLTVIATNYSEVKWIKPVGYSLAGLLAFQMVSSKVHWTSDYPFAVLFGYVIGKNIAHRRIHKTHAIKIGQQEINYKTNLSLSNINGFTTIGLHVSF